MAGDNILLGTPLIYHYEPAVDEAICPSADTEINAKITTVGAYLQVHPHKRYA
jgi:hypothetical protein